MHSKLYRGEAFVPAPSRSTIIAVKKKKNGFSELYNELELFSSVSFDLGAKIAVFP